MYCAVSDLTTRFERHELIRLTDKDGSAGDIVNAVVETAISDASATINGYLAGVVRLPLSRVPDNLNHLCADIARYYLYDDSLDEQHPAYRRYKVAMDYLKSVAKGDIRLDLPAETANESATNLAEFASAGSVFARGRAKGFL